MPEKFEYNNETKENYTDGVLFKLDLNGGREWYILLRSQDDAQCIDDALNQLVGTINLEVFLNGLMINKGIPYLDIGVVDGETLQFGEHLRRLRFLEKTDFLTTIDALFIPYGYYFDLAE